MKFTRLDGATGQVLCAGDAGDLTALETHDTMLLAGVELHGGWVADMQHHQVPDAPSADAFWVWSWVSKTWVDQRTPAQVAADASAAQRRVLLSRLTALEQRQARPLREISMAQVDGVAPPDGAVGVMRQLVSEIHDVRAALLALV